MKIEVSNGEILDKLSILEIKNERIRDEEKLKNIRTEISELQPTADSLLSIDGVPELYKDLKNINSRLWDIEDLIRDCERRSDFGTGFIELARAVYQTNDMRSEVKRKMNIHTGSLVIEEKSYQKY
jgi:hypothetical protein